MLALLALVGSPVLLLALPVDLRFRAHGDAIDRALVGRFRLEWLGGRVGRTLELGARRRERAGRARKLPTREQLRLVSARDFRARVAELLRRWSAWTSIAELHARARIGLGDPADTGLALGLILPLVEAARQRSALDLEVTAEWGDACLAGQVDGTVRTVPIALLVALGVFALQPVTLRTVWRLRSLPR